MVRIIDSNEITEKVYQNKFKANSVIVDLNIRRQFHRSTQSVVKCIVGCNHCAMRHRKINVDLPLKNACTTIKQKDSVMWFNAKP